MQTVSPPGAHTIPLLYPRVPSSNLHSDTTRLMLWCSQKRLPDDSIGTFGLEYNMVLVANFLRPFVQLTPRAELSSLGSCLELCPVGEAKMDQGN
jgi:hypothetical protein